MAVKKILIVDDSPTERAFLEGVLTKAGYTVVQATSGEEGVERAKAEIPDLILMDVVMPGLNGFQATRAITREEATKHVPVFICTTKDQETDKIWGMRQGAKDYLVKPVNAAELLAKIKALGSSRTTMARKTSLREFQQNFALRLRDLSSRKTVASKLGFQVGADNFFVTLSDVSEVIPVPVFVTVPQTQSWFRGVSNVRGKLYSTIDFASFQGAAATTPSMERRVILIHEKLIEGAGLLVNRMLGLRNPETFVFDSGQDLDRPWIKARYRDPNAAIWHELDVSVLASDARFLEVGLMSIGHVANTASASAALVAVAALS